MGFYDAFKDVVKLAQKADNLELYRQLLDLSAQALDLQEENIKLKEEIYNLSKEKEVERHIVRHDQPFITLDDDEQNLPYCAVCWTKEKKLYQMGREERYGKIKGGSALRRYSAVAGSAASAARSGQYHRGD